MPVTARIRIDTRRLNNLRKGFAVGLRAGGSGPVAQMLDSWGERYLGDIRQNFRDQSRGGWEPLKRRTREERRRLGFNPVTPILIRGGTLFYALYRGTPGNLFRRIVRGVRLGFNPTDRHPGYATPKGHVGRGVRIADIAAAHNLGRGRNPRRAILVVPLPATVLHMLNDVRAAVRDLTH